ncbi:MAG: acyl-CoA dehydrogenase family protein, partial [Pseudomonadota bacterium]
MIQLEISEQHQKTYENARLLAEHMMRPYSRKYDKAEHTFPKEMEEVSAILAQNASKPRGDKPEKESATVKNGGNIAAVVGMQALAWGDLGLFLAIPGSGLGNAAINAVGTAEQRAKFGKTYAAMCITEPGTGSDSA